jgi:hypothetical protein
LRQLALRELHFVDMLWLAHVGLSVSAVPRLEAPLSSFDKPTHMVVRIAICLCSLALSATGVDFETKAKSICPDDLAQLVDFAL